MNSTILTTEVNIFAPDFTADRDLSDDAQIIAEANRHGLIVVSVLSSYEGSWDVIVLGTQAQLDLWREEVGYGNADGFSFTVEGDRYVASGPTR